MWTDVLPLILFFGFYKIQGIYAATGAAIVAGVLGAIYRYRKEGHLEPLPLLSLALIVVLGGLTIYLKDPKFLIWKPTVAYTATALFFAYSCRAGQTPMVKRMLQSSLKLSDIQWRNATLLYVGYFMFAAVLNLVVGYNVSLDLWVKYKVFGTITMSMIFMVGHSMWLSGRQIPELSGELGLAAEVAHEMSEIGPSEP